MRQIYNTAESPEMVLFQLTDAITSHGDLKPAQTFSHMPMIETSTGQSSCKNTSRLSLANLLPSRLESIITFMIKNLFFFFFFNIYQFAKHLVSSA